MSEANILLMSGQQHDAPRFVIKNLDVEDLRISSDGGAVVITPNVMAEFVITHNEDGLPTWTVRKQKSDVRS